MDNWSIKLPLAKLNFPNTDKLVQYNELILDLLLDISDAFNDPFIYVIPLTSPICIMDAFFPILKLVVNVSILEV